MVFISFRHENDAHRARVRSLADQLLADGVVVVLDEIFLEQNPGGPDKTWPHWCREQVEKADKVLMVPTPGWVASYDKEDSPEAGPGAAYEAHVIRQKLYELGTVNPSFRVLLFEGMDHATVPTDLRGYHAYNVENDASYNHLKRWLTDGPAPAESSDHWLEAPPELPWPLADHDPLRDAFATMLTREAPHRILLVEGPTEHGKTCATEPPPIPSNAANLTPWTKSNFLAVNYRLRVIAQCG